MSLELMKARMNAIGGPTNDDRIVKGKLQSLRSAKKNSYQAEWITFKDEKWRCLINPIKLSTDYDQKEISIEFESGMKPGEVFYWDRTQTYWMVIDRRYTEEAYFRGEIRRCDYEIQAKENKYHIWLRGPVETDLVWRQKHSIEYNEMNYSLMFYVIKNEETNEFFKRHQILKFDNHNWRVAAVDRYTQPDIIEVYLEEYFDNEMQDAQTATEIIEPDTTVPYIDGPLQVYPYDTDLSYSIQNTDMSGTWSVSNGKAKITAAAQTTCSIDIVTGRSGDFVIKYSDGDNVIAELPIVIKSL